MSGMAFVEVDRTLIQVDAIESVTSRYGYRPDGNGGQTPRAYIEVRTRSGAVHYDSYQSLADFKARLERALVAAEGVLS